MLICFFKLLYAAKDLNLLVFLGNERVQDDIDLPKFCGDTAS